MSLFRYVVNQVPKSINKRLTTIYKDESSFKGIGGGPTFFLLKITLDLR